MDYISTTLAPELTGLSVIIPAYNEERFILPLLQRVKQSLNQLDIANEIIVVNDGSTDATLAIADNFAKENPIMVLSQANQGKGSAVQYGIREASLSHVLVQDADLEYDPEDYFQLVSCFQTNPKIYSIYGSRILGQAVIKKRIFPFFGKHAKQGLLPWLANIGLTTLVLILYGKLITDTLTAYKIYPKVFFEKHQIKSTGFEADHEITALMLKNKLVIQEVPIQYSPRSRSEGKKIGFSDLIKACLTFIRLRFS